jgi:hypothetical protein
LVELLKTADIVIESFAPCYLDRLGLGYRALAEKNPALISISITPFGQKGPKANWAATDLTVTAASNTLLLTGDEDRPPVHRSAPQAYQHAGIEAAAGALIALERSAVATDDAQEPSTTAPALHRRLGGSRHRVARVVARNEPAWRLRVVVAESGVSIEFIPGGHRAISRWPRASASNS